MPSNFKVLNLGDPGSPIQFGGDDLDKVNQYLNGDDLGITIPINTETKYTSSKLALADSTGSYKIGINTSAETQNGALTIPTINGSTQQVVTTAAGQTLTNKTINALGGGNNITGITDTNIDSNAGITWTKVSKAFSSVRDLADTQISVTPASGDVIQYNGTKWVNSPLSGGGGSGEINTASNVGSAGVGVFKQKVLADLQFKKLNPLSSRITITDDTANSKIDFDVNLGAITFSSITGTVSSSQIAASAVTTAAIADANVTLAKLATSSVDSSKIVDLSITNSDISNTAAIAWGKVSKTGSTIDDIADVVLTSPTSAQVLTYNGTAWINQTPATSTSSTFDPVNNAKWGALIGGQAVDATSGKTGSMLCGNYIYACSTSPAGATGIGADGFGTFYGLYSGTTAGAFCQIDSYQAGVFRAQFNPKMYFRIAMDRTTNIRWYIGFTTNISLTAFGNGNFLNGQHGYGFRYDSTIDSTIKALSNNGQATQTTYDLGITPVANALYNFSTVSNNSGAPGYTISIGVNSFSGTLAVNLPAIDQIMGFMARAELPANSGTQSQFKFYYGYFKMDS